MSIEEFTAEYEKEKRSRYWFFDYQKPRYVPDVLFAQSHLTGGLEYAIYHSATCDKGVNYLSGFVVLVRTQRKSYVQKLIAEAKWWPVTNATACFSYVKHPTGNVVDGPHEFGQWKVGLHQKVPLEKRLAPFREAIKAGKTLSQIADDEKLLPLLAKYPRLYRHLKEIYEVPTSDEEDEEEEEVVEEGQIPESLEKHPSLPPTQDMLAD